VQRTLNSSENSATKKNLGSNLADTIAFSAKLLDQVKQGVSLTEAMVKIPMEIRSAVQSLTFDALRFKPKILQALGQYLHKQIDSEVEDIFVVAISTLFSESQNKYTPYTLVNETVKACEKSPKTKHAKGLINAVLRKLIAHPEVLKINPLDAQYPSWWVKTLSAAFPNALQEILEVNLQPSKMFLRVNPKKITKKQYLELLDKAEYQSLEVPKQWQELAPNAIALQRSIPVQQLPGFNEGLFSVQDLGAQLATYLLNPQDGQRILDACCAPGGKASGLLEVAEITLDALDISESRLERVRTNLTRLNLQANLIVGDATQSNIWWNGEKYDAIVADVPCSATGIMRRHPDILYLRRYEDIQQLQKLQRKIIVELWKTLKPGGKMLFVTCSILPQEGEQQLSWITKNLQDALRLECFGQLLPNDWHDGFYYGLLQKADG
jgi:16S rRNA (cytosine967-C5)-methyltransferase